LRSHLDVQYPEGHNMGQFQRFQRPHFFSGQLLTAEDLEQEQDYFLARSRRHNRFLHGWGVGLDWACRLKEEQPWWLNRESPLTALEMR
jgi:hypothetical protein